MAYYNSGFVVVGACVILLAAVADAQLNGLNVAGVLNCPSGTGLPTGPGIPGATVGLNCTVVGSNVRLGQGQTDANGTFNISVGNILESVGGLLPIIGGGGRIIPCTVGTVLPINQTVCPILNTANAVLIGVPTVVNATLTAARGLVATAIATPVVAGTVAVGV